MISLRPYQTDVVNSVYDHLRTRDDNPCAVVPTAGGKTPIMASICKDAVGQWDGRVLILAHVKELLEQTADKLRIVCPEINFGIYSAGLKRRDTNHPVIVAGIQSVYKRACELDAFNLIMVDEAHLIPLEGDGMYRQFLADAKVINPEVRIIGFTATPYRLKTGPICTDDGFLNHICYEVGVRELIRDGFLCPLISKAGRAKADTSALHIRGGEFVSDEVESLMDQDSLVRSACGEIMEYMADRNACLIFASGVQHGEHIVEVLAQEHGVECGFVCGDTDLTMLGEAFKFVGPMAKTAGVSLEEITAAIQLLSNAGIQGEMAGTTLRGMFLSLTSPSSEAKRELDRLGVSVTDSAGNVRSLAAIIGDLESSLAGAGSGDRLRVLGTIFPARQAAGAAELISQGAARLKEATAALGTASGTAANIAGTQLDTLRGDATILMSALEGLGIAVGEALGDSLRTGIQAITGLLSILAQWVSENRAIVMTVVGIIAGVALIGGALVSLGIALQITAFGFAGLATAIGLVGSLIGALLSPIGLLVGLVVALGAYLLYTSEAGGQALAWLGERFSILKDDATKAWGAIGKALASGDIAMAGRILWLTLKMEWQRGIHFLNGLWVKFKEFFLAMTTDAVFGASKIINDGWSGVEVAWTETVGFLADAWSLFVNGLTKTWHSTIGFIRKAWVRLKSLFDSEIDVNAEVNRINAETDAAYQNADDQMLEAVGQRDQERRDRRQQIERDRKATGDTLSQMQRAEHEQRQQGFNDDLVKTESELANARDEWQAALAEVEQTTPADTSTPEGKKLKELQHSLALGAGVVGDQQNKVEVKGTFNALGARGLGSDSLAERTARASEQIVINTQELLDEAKQGGLVFGQ